MIIKDSISFKEKNERLREMDYKYKVLLFYKYINIPDPAEFRDEHFRFCEENSILGRIYIAEEGINGTVSGEPGNIEKYKRHLRSFPFFSDIVFKEDNSRSHAFRKLIVRVKKEIVNSGLSGANPENGGKRLSPEELKSFYEENRDFVIIDARNDYESEIGRFKNAITPKLETFRDWAKIPEIYPGLKNKTVITYCTGGIRCEKASAYLVEQGFRDVYQLDGGIVTYNKKFPDTYWEGAVFVFDERRIIEPNSSDELKHIAKCYYCGKPASYYINCHNQECNKKLVTCLDCKTENDYCCSDECRNAGNKRKYYHG